MKDSHRKDSQQELFKSVNLLFSSLEPAYIWQYAGSLVERACSMLQELNDSGIEASETVDTVRPVGAGQPCLIEVCFEHVLYLMHCS